MDAHFKNMLSPESLQMNDDQDNQKQRFIPYDSFKGPKRGFVFKTGNLGLGYYEDPKQSKYGNEVDPSELNLANRKRKRQETDNSIEKNKITTDASTENKKNKTIKNDKEELEVLLLKAEQGILDPKELEHLLEMAEKNNDIAPLDLNGLRQMILSFERAINKNQMMRVKYQSEPEKFMESEVDLDEEIKKMAAVAAAPEMYPQLVELRVIESILGLLCHENTDISIRVLSLLNELTDPDVISESEGAEIIIDKIIGEQGLELLIQNLGRLDESQDEDAQGVYDTMAIIENMIEVKPIVCTIICEKTGILKYLLQRIRIRKFDPNKQYCSEILSILIQGSSENQRRLATIQDLDAIDVLLQTIFYYRKRDPGSLEEAECIENLFDALCNSLLRPENQTRFRNSEGFELMVKCVQEKKYSAVCAMKALDFALTNNATNCQRFVEVGGLKVLFPALMGRESARILKKPKKELRKLFIITSKKKSKKNEQDFDQEDEDGDEEDANQELERKKNAFNEHVVSIISTLFSQLAGEGKYQIQDIIKIENNATDKTHEKNIQKKNSDTTETTTTTEANQKSEFALRVLGKFIENNCEKFDRVIELFFKYYDRLNLFNEKEYETKSNDHNDDDDDDDDEDAIYLKKLGAGLFLLQKLVYIITYVTIHSSICSHRLKQKLRQEGKSIDEIKEILAEYIQKMGNNIQDDDSNKDEVQRIHNQQQLLSSWLAVL